MQTQTVKSVKLQIGGFSNPHSFATIGQALRKSGWSSPAVSSKAESVKKVDLGKNQDQHVWDKKVHDGLKQLAFVFHPNGGVVGTKKIPQRTVGNKVIPAKVVEVKVNHAFFGIEMPNSGYEWLLKTSYVPEKKSLANTKTRFAKDIEKLQRLQKREVV